MGPLHLAVRGMHGCSHGCTVVDVSGEVDIVTAPHLCGCVGRLLDAGTGQVVLNLSSVTFMDARGLTALVSIRRHAGAARVLVQLAALPPLVRRLLRVTHLDASFAIVADPVHPADHPHTAGRRMASRRTGPAD
ncbi:STAS domain-containing protein [Streptosporangium sp. NBC_01756]|uniref:STAS domain-containing protein n=1 Tax=Streptosporangium sp. NBC_01756 TaxID=2975950 RepID=UPI002DD7BA60|nr:STAS domain-containing protein [Streptosporangium sp. NBC_01756]WSC85708.1 STAS domain-containing protein [Streptosporangium sp. NBC_01756]